MQYLGGKFLVAKQFRTNLQQVVPYASRIWDAFCGGLGFAENFADYHLICTDINPHLICLYRAWQCGWRPDLGSIDKNLHTRYKQVQPLGDPLTAFLGIACSFSGKWFAGYLSAAALQVTTKKRRNYHKNGFNSLNRFFDKAANVTFRVNNFLTTKQSPPRDVVIYCDPPYANTSNYNFVGDFDHHTFWKRCSWYVKQGNHVFVSEQTAPESWHLIWQCERKVAINRLRTSAAPRSIANDKVISEKLWYKGPK